MPSSASTTTVVQRLHLSLAVSYKLMKEVLLVPEEECYANKWMMNYERQEISIYQRQEGPLFEIWKLTQTTKLCSIYLMMKD